MLSFRAKLVEKELAIHLMTKGATVIRLTIRESRKKNTFSTFLSFTHIRSAPKSSVKGECAFIIKRRNLR